MRYFFFVITMILIQSLDSTCYAYKKQNVTQASIQRLMVLGDSCAAVFDYFHALIFYRQAYDSVHSLAATRKLANVYSKMGRDKECSSLLRCIPTDSVNYFDLRSLYFAYRSMGLVDSLLAYGDIVANINPYDCEIVESMASYCNAIGIPERAALICNRYLQGDSTNTLIRRQLGYASYLSGKYENAYKTYRQLEKEGLDNYESNYVMGYSLEKMDSVGAAYDYLLKAAKYKDFNDYATLRHLGAVCISLGLNDEGLGYISKAIELKTPDSTLMSTLHWELARAYFNKHNYTEAAVEFEKCAMFRPDSPLNYYNIAQMYGAVGNKKKEIENYVVFLKKSTLLKDTDENRELIANVKDFLRKHNKKNGKAINN